MKKRDVHHEVYEFSVPMALVNFIPVFALCFFCYMAMGYLTSRDSSSAAMNWAEQGANCLGQALLLGGVYALHRAGLRECRLL